MREKKEYEGIIAKLFLMDKSLLEQHIGDIDSIKEILQNKGFSKNIIDAFEKEYKGFLKEGYYYGDIKTYPEHIQEKVRENEKKLDKIKAEITEIYEGNKGLLEFLGEIGSFLENEMNDIVDREKQKNTISLENLQGLENNIIKLQQTIKEIKDKIDNKESERKSLENNKNIQKNTLATENNKNFIVKSLSSSKRKQIKEGIEQMEDDIKVLNDEIKKLENELQNLNVEVQNKKELIENINNIKKRLIGTKKHLALNGYNNFFSEIEKILKQIIANSKGLTKEELKKDFLIQISDFLKDIVKLIPYLDKEDQEKLESKIYKEIRSLAISELSQLLNNMQNQGFDKKIDEYINYFFMGKHNGYINQQSKKLLTVYTKNKFDKDIILILKTLGGINSTYNYKIKEIDDIFNEGYIDEDFLDSVFIHQSGFATIDDILKDGFVKSKNLLFQNKDATNDSPSGKDIHKNNHLDFYFSRGFVKHIWYGFPKNLSQSEKKLENKVFIVNYMRKFAEKGYGIPININSQKDSEGYAYYDEELVGYSIISREPVSKTINMYHKYEEGTQIDIRDIYIFVAESKKEEVEKYIEEYIKGYKYMKNYDPSELHIIYIPDEYYKNQLNKVAQQEQIINEFIISELDKGKEENTTILPVEVVYSNESGIRSIRNTRPYVFFEKTNNNKKKEKGNKEIKDYTDTPDNIIALIKKLGLDLEADSQNVKRILNNFESSAAKKKLPLDFSKDLMRIGLALSSFGDIHTGLIMRFLRSHGQSRRDTMILDLLIQMSNFLVKKKAKGNFIDKFTEFAENYSSINIKDLFHLFYIYHISVITNNPQIFDKKQHEKTLEDAKLLLDRQEKEVSKK